MWRSIFTLTNTSSFISSPLGGSNASTSIDSQVINLNCSLKSTVLLSLCPASEHLPLPWWPLLLDLFLDLEFPLSLDLPLILQWFVQQALVQWFHFWQLRHLNSYKVQLSLVLEECSRQQLGHCLDFLPLLVLFLIL